MTIQYTACVNQSRKGEGYIARADELGVHGERASTIRRAIKNLEAAVRAYLDERAGKGSLAAELVDAGYDYSTISVPDGQYAVNTQHDEQVVLTMPRKARNALLKAREAPAAGESTEPELATEGAEG